MNTIDRTIIESALTYEAYRKVITNLLSQDKTTGLIQSESLLHYTKLNETRMNRLDKTTILTADSLEKLAHITQPQIWLVLTEAWCGDAAQAIPVMNKLAAANPNITLRLLLRDEHPAIMDAFLTDGSRSIPKLIALDADTLEVFATWGPRSKTLQAILLPQLAEIKQIADPDLRSEKMNEWKTGAQSWYNRDKTRSTQGDLLEAVLEKVEVD